MLDTRANCWAAPFSWVKPRSPQPPAYSIEPLNRTRGRHGGTRSLRRLAREQAPKDQLEDSGIGFVDVGGPIDRPIIVITEPASLVGIAMSEADAEQLGRALLEAVKVRREHAAAPKAGATLTPVS